MPFCRYNKRATWDVTLQTYIFRSLHLTEVTSKVIDAKSSVSTTHFRSKRKGFCSFRGLKNSFSILIMTGKKKWFCCFLAGIQLLRGVHTKQIQAKRTKAKHGVQLQDTDISIQTPKAALVGWVASANTTAHRPALSCLFRAALIARKQILVEKCENVPKYALTVCPVKLRLAATERLELGCI